MTVQSSDNPLKHACIERLSNGVLDVSSFGASVALIHHFPSGLGPESCEGKTQLFTAIKLQQLCNGLRCFGILDLSVVFSFVCSNKLLSERGKYIVTLG